MSTLDLPTALRQVAAALAAPDQPGTTYRAVDHATAGLIGHKLFTLMIYDQRERTVGRVYSSQPTAYPVGGRKPYSASTLFDRLIVDQEPVVLRTADEIKRAFVDHALIASLGCESGIFVPVVYGGRTLGLLNLAHQAQWYDEGHIALLAPFAALLTTPLLLALRGDS